MKNELKLQDNESLHDWINRLSDALGFKYHTIDALMSFGNTKRNEVSLNNCGMYLHELQHVLRLCGIKKEIVP